MKGKFLKKLVVMIMVTSFLAMTSATAFAQSANKGNNFSILENIPNAQAVQLSDAEMKDVKGEGVVTVYEQITMTVGNLIDGWKNSGQSVNDVSLLLVELLRIHSVQTSQGTPFTDPKADIEQAAININKPYLNNSIIVPIINGIVTAKILLKL